MEKPDKTLRRNLETAMAARGWKKSDLARAAELSLSTLYPLFDEKQLAWPQPQTLAKVARALNVTVAQLFMDTDPTPLRPVPPTPQEALAVIARELETHRETPARDPLAEKLARLGPDARRAIEVMVDGALLQETPKQGGKAPEKGK